MPTFVVQPFFGAETVSQTGIPNQLNSVPLPVFLIYWGSYWGLNPTEVANVRNAAGLVINSPYLNEVQQYQVQGQAVLDPTTAYDSSDPANPFKTGSNGNAIGDVVQNQIDNGPLPEPDSQNHNAAIYVVITPPGVRSDLPTAAGFNTNSQDYDVGDVDTIPEVWASTNYLNGNNGPVNLDNFTSILGHELAEIMTDFPQGKGFQVNPPAGAPSGSGNQIGDYEGNSYSYRLGNGAFVQPLWSVANNAWVVTDGNNQTVQATANAWPIQVINGQNTPVWDGKYNVVINGDQLPGNPNDFIQIGTAIVGGKTDLQINLNGELFQFDTAPGALGTINNLTINTGGGNDTVILNSGPGVNNLTINQGSLFRPSTLTVIAKVPVTIVQRSLLPSTLTVTAQAPVTINGFTGSIVIANQSITTVNATPANAVFVTQNSGGGNLTVNNAGALVLGAGGTVNTFTAFTTITDTSGRTALTIDDSADPLARTIILSPASVSGLTNNPLSFALANLSSLTVNGGKGGNLVTVTDTLSRINSIVNTGTGTDAVFIEGTTGPLTVNGQNGLDDVLVGFAGSLQSINGVLTVTNVGSYSTLTLVDTADPVQRMVTMDVGATYGTISGISPALIRYQKDQVRSLTVSAGAGSDSFTINNTALTNFRRGTMTTVNTGGGAHSILVNGTTGPLTIIGQGILNNIVVGSMNGGLNLINGALYISGPTALNFLSVNDGASTTSHNYVVDKDFVQREDKAVINYQDIAALNVTAGSQTDQITVQNTMPSNGFFGGTTINTGGGDDPIYIHRTTGSLFINAGGFSFIEVIPSLDAIQGPIQINAAAQATNSVTLSLEDTATTTPQQLDIKASAFGASFQRSGAASISVIFSQLGLFQWISGSGGDTINVYGRPAQSCNFILGNDTLNLGTHSRRISNFGPISVAGGPGFDSVNLNDSGESQPQTYRFSVQSGVDQFAALGTTVTVGAGVEAITLNGGKRGNAIAVTGTAPGTAVTINTGTGNNTTTVGNPLGAIQGPLTVNGQGSSDSLSLNDGFSLSPQFYNLSAAQLTRTDSSSTPDMAPISFTGISTVTLNDGSGPSNSVNVTGSAAGTAVNIFGNPASSDQITIGADSNAILGPVTFYGQPANNDFAVYFDYPNASPQTYTLLASGLNGAGEEVDRSGLAPVVFNGMTEVILASASDTYFSPLAGNNVVNVQSLPAGVFLNMELDGRDQMTVGSTAPNLGGTLANIQGTIAVNDRGHHQIALTLDDSGNADPTPRKITLGPSNGSDYGNHIDGLTTNTFFWNLDATSSISILGGAGNKTFAITGASFLPAIRIDGGGGVNTLDYSAYKGLPGLVAWYRGEGNANDAVAGNNGTVHGGVTYVPGKVGQAFSFNGVDSYVQVTESFAQESPTVSVEAWVNSTSTKADTYILAKGANGDAAASYALDTGPNSGLQFYVYDGGTFVASPDAGSSIWDGNWHHVVGTYDGANVRLYVDGAEIGNGTPTNLQISYSLPTTNDLFIGTYGNLNSPSQHFFNGLVDEASVYNRALSAAEVQSIFAAGSAGKSAAVIGVYVNLRTGEATELRGGIANIQNVTGSPFDNILVGNGGNVLNAGGGGRNLLIAGGAASILLSGSGEDILIAGTTAYDQNATALAAILAEWTDPNVDYATRVANLLAGNGVPALNAKTVQTNGGANTLTGGPGLDLFFGDLHNDTTDWNPNLETFVSI